MCLVHAFLIGLRLAVLAKTRIHPAEKESITTTFPLRTQIVYIVLSWFGCRGKSKKLFEKYPWKNIIKHSKRVLSCSLHRQISFSFPLRQFHSKIPSKDFKIYCAFMHRTHFAEKNEGMAIYESHAANGFNWFSSVIQSKQFATWTCFY